MATLPSRAATEHAVRTALRDGASTVVLGASGSGRTTLLSRLRAERVAQHLGTRADAHAPTHAAAQAATPEPARSTGFELRGSAVLTGTPFAHLAALATQLPELAHYARDPLAAAHLMDALRGRSPLRVFVDDAEHLDPASCAVLTQLAAVGTLQLALSVSEGAELTADLAGFLARPETVCVTLGKIDVADARALLEEQFAHPVNASAATRLLEETDGTPAALAHGAEAARRAGRLRSARGYLVLTAAKDPAAHSIPALSRDDRLRAAERLAQSGDRDGTLALLAPLLTTGDAAARLLAGRAEVLSGDAANGIKLLTPRPDDDEQFRAASALWLAHAGQPFDAARFAEWSQRSDFPAELGLGLLAAVVVHEVYAGDPAAALERAFAGLDGPGWEQATGPDRGALLYALHLALLSEGSHEHASAPRLAHLDWEALDLDHGLFIASRAYVLAEYGSAAEALELAEQVLALTEVSDPHGIAGFVAAVGAGAAAMLEDRERAAGLLVIYRASVAHSGQLLRPEAERLALGAILAAEGEQAARGEFESLRDRARSERRAFLVMRLEHEAWRLRLTDSTAALAAVAKGVTGQLAEALRQLPNPAAIEDIASSQHAHGRSLFAAEFLADAARAALNRGDRARAQTLLADAAELANQLTGVNTPRIARVRVDPALLSARETEVCVRAASGLTNTEIADELFLSHRTVEGHLQRAYAKLGVSDRRQLFLPYRGGDPT